MSLLNCHLQDCPSCSRDLAGRNHAMERIARLVFPPGPHDGPHDGLEEGAEGGAGPSAPLTEETEE